MVRAAPTPGRAAKAKDSVTLDRVVAVVGDEIILESELERTTERHPALQQALQKLPASANATQVAAARQEVQGEVLDELIDIALMKAEAEKFDIRVTPEEVEQYLLDIARQNGLTVEELKVQVERAPEYGSWDEYQGELKEQILMFKVPRYLTQWSVSDAQIREHYRKMTRDESAKVEVEQFTVVPGTRDRADRDQAFARAQEIGRRLRAGEEAQAIEEALPAGATRSTPTVARGDIAPALEDAIFAAQEKQVVGPLASGQGYVVFKVIDHLESAALSFEEAKDKIRQQLEAEAFMKAEQDLRRQLRAKAHIDIRL